MAWGNLMVSVHQQQDLPQNETVSTRKTVTLLCACLTIVDVEKQ